MHGDGNALCQKDTIVCSIQRGIRGIKGNTEKLAQQINAYMAVEICFL